MGFEPGRTKTGGRTKGTPNRASQSLKDALESANFDVIAEMLRLYPGLDDFAKVQVLKDLMQYLYPKLKAVEHTHNPPEIPNDKAEADLIAKQALALIQGGKA